MGVADFDDDDDGDGAVTDGTEFCGWGDQRRIK